MLSERVSALNFPLPRLGFHRPAEISQGSPQPISISLPCCPTNYNTVNAVTRNQGGHGSGARCASSSLFSSGRVQVLWRKTDSPGHMSSRASILIRTLAQVETLTEYIRLETSLQLNDREMQTLTKALINLWMLQVNHGVQAPHTVSGLSSVHLLS